MGDQADDILSSFGLSQEDSNKYDTVKENFQGFLFTVKSFLCIGTIDRL